MKKFIITDLAKGNATITADQILEIGGESGGGGTTGDYIPLRGTEVGKPVTNKIVFIDNEDAGIVSESEIIRGAVTFSDEGTQISSRDKINNKTFAIFVRDRKVIIDDYSDSSDVVGITGTSYYGANYTDNTYVQKKYVDDANSYSTDEIKTGGTWIDGKPIYRKVITGIMYELGGKPFFDFDIFDYTQAIVSSNAFVEDTNSTGYNCLLNLSLSIFNAGGSVSHPDNDPSTIGQTAYIILEYTKTTDVAP